MYEDLVYASFAPFYEAFHSEKPYRRIASWIVEQASLKKGDTIIDAGCGGGHLSVRLADEGLRVIGMDVSPDMLAIAQQRAEKRAVTLLQADLAQNLPFPKAKAIVLCLDVVHYLPSEDAFLRMLRRAQTALPPNGVLIFDMLVPGFLEARARSGPIRMEKSGRRLLWKTRKESADRIVYDLALFTKTSSRWRKETERQRLQILQPDRLLRRIETTDFQVVGIHDGYRNRPVHQRSPRWVWVLKKKSGGKLAGNR